MLVAVFGFDQGKAIGVISVDALGARTERYHVGNMARVEVTGVRTLKIRRIVLELRPAAKKER